MISPTLYFSSYSMFDYEYLYQFGLVGRTSTNPTDPKVNDPSISEVNDCSIHSKIKTDLVYYIVPLLELFNFYPFSFHLFSFDSLQSKISHCMEMKIIYGI